MSRPTIASPQSLALLLIAPACQLFGSPYTAKETRVLKVPHTGVGSLTVETRNGSIDVRGGRRTPDVAVTAHLIAGGDSPEEAEERLDDVEVTCRPDDRGVLVVLAAFPGERRRSDGASFEVTIPDADGLNLVTSNGRIHATGLRGAARLQSSNGALVLKDHRGGVVLHTSNGSVTVTDHDGSVEARTSNGPIRVRLTDQTPGPLQLHTSNGGIDARVGAAFAGQIRMRTSNGRVAVRDHGKHAVSWRLDRRRGTVVFRGTGQSTLRTSNGSIRLGVQE